MLNKVQLIGRLGRDPETKFTGSGKAVCNFTVATDETYKDKAGERQKKTEWHRIVVWGKLADICQKYLIKGSLVFLEGRIQSRTWDDKSGQKKTAVEINCHEMKMLSKNENGDKSQHSEVVAEPVPQEISDEDIPF